MMGGSASLETQIHRKLPEGVEMATTRVPFHNVSYKGLLEMVDKIPEAARILAEARPNVIAVTSFTGSCIRGREMVNVIQQATGIPAIVPAPEFVRVLRLIGASHIAIVTCFETELRMLERVFFHNNGIEVVRFVSTAALRETDPFQVSQIDYDLVLKQLRGVDFSGVEAVVVDLPTFFISPELQRELERFIKVPVLNMVQVLLWSTLGWLGEPTDGLYISKFLP